MARAVMWTRAARADVREIRAHIAVGSPSAARHVTGRIQEALRSCRDFPYGCRLIPEFNDPQRRETFAYAYRVTYRVEPHCIRVLRVVHGQRLLKNIPGSFEES